MNKLVMMSSAVLLLGLAACSDETAQETDTAPPPATEAEPAAPAEPAATPEPEPEEPAAEAATPDEAPAEPPAAADDGEGAMSDDGDGAMADDGDGAMADAPGGSDVSDAAIQACLEAVQAQTNEPDQAVLSTEFSEANSLVMVGVGPDRAPWRCLVSNDGQVQEVYFDGDEGAL